jgi:hypothetical protein
LSFKTTETRTIAFEVTLENPLFVTTYNAMCLGGASVALRWRFTGAFNDAF